MSKLKTVFGAAFLFVLLSFGVSFAQNLPPTLTVDYKLLFLLHPLMAEFDWSLGRHIKPEIDLTHTAKLDKINLEMGEINVQAKAECANIQKEIDKLLVQIEKAGKTGNISIDSTNASAPPGLEQTIEKTQIQKKDLIAKIEALKIKRDQIMDSVFDPMYISRDRSREIQKKALKEIDKILQRISNENGGALIIDSSFIRDSEPPKSFYPSTEACTNLLSVGLRQTLLDKEFKVGFPPDSPYYNASETMKKFASSMNRQEDFKIAVSTILAKYPGVRNILGTEGRFFLVGNESSDVTLKVLGEILQQNHVKDTIASSVIELLQTRE
ncbi:MAG: hypothetical protein HQM08_07380 [Candidatus Riflebacteria bacterium]|nr:hypothetical protein [Candidatus Riflebacteria bacterium]